MINTLSRLLYFEEKKIFFSLLLIIVGVSFTETFGIFLIYSLIKKEKIFNIDFFLDKDFFFILYSIIIFFIFKSFLLNFLSWKLNQFVRNFSLRNSELLLRIYLNKELNFYTKHNSSELIKNNYSEINKLAICYDSCTRLLGEIFVLIFVVCFLLFFNFSITFFFLIFSSLVGLIFILFSKKNLEKFNYIDHIYTGIVLKNLQEAFRSIRDIYIYSLAKFYIKKFIKNYFILREANFFSAIIKELPKNNIELILIFLVFLFLKFEDENLFKIQKTFDIGFLLVVFFSAFRLVPGILRIVGFFNTINNHKKTVNVLYFLLKKKKKFFLKKKKINFKKQISVKNISFKYPRTNSYIFKNLNLNIKKNQKYLITGSSGCGKTTLVDILTGLLNPTQGNVLIDKSNLKNIKQAWFENVSYMSQNSQLFDSTILENITLNDYPDNINKNNLKNALKNSNSNNFVWNLQKNLNYNVGENGQKLSGGQRQRILLARALYKSSDVLIFDESFSALDLKNTKKILQLIKNIKDRTIIIIHHNITKLNFVDYEINFKKKIVNVKKNRKF